MVGYRMDSSSLFVVWTSRETHRTDDDGPQTTTTRIRWKGAEGGEWNGQLYIVRFDHSSESVANTETELLAGAHYGPQHPVSTLLCLELQFLRVIFGK